MLVGLWLGLAPATPELVRLQWEAPASCPDRGAVLAMIDRSLGEVDDSPRREVDVRGTLRVEGSTAFVLDLTLDEGRGGTRRLRGSSCEELSEAAALVVAMAIDPRLLERSAERPSETEAEVPSASSPIATSPEAEPDPEAEAESEPVPVATSPSTVAVDEPADAPAGPARDRALAFVARFDGGVGGGPLPGASGVAMVALGLIGRGFRAELTGSYWPPSSTVSETNPRVGVRAQLWTVGAQGCGEPRVGPVSIPLCAGLHAGAVHAIGTGAQSPLRVASRWVAVVIEPGVVWWARPRLGLAVRASGHVAVARPQWRSEPSGAIFAAAPVGGTVRAGLELRLP
ncbi:MAG: hypothetical protein AB1Z98_00870 [Nannocystaceae bacterium]